MSQQHQVWSSGSTRGYRGASQLISSSAAGQRVGRVFAVWTILSQLPSVCMPGVLGLRSWGMQPRGVLLYSMSAALRSQEITGGARGLHRGTRCGCFNLKSVGCHAAESAVCVPSECWGSSSLVSPTPGFSGLLDSAANCLNLFWKFCDEDRKEEADFQQYC